MSEWRVVLTYDPIRSADPRRSVAHLASRVIAYDTEATILLAKAPCKARALSTWSLTAPAKKSDKRCERCSREAQ